MSFLLIFRKIRIYVINGQILNLMINYFPFTPFLASAIDKRCFKTIIIFFTY